MKHWKKAAALLLSAFLCTATAAPACADAENAAAALDQSIADLQNQSKQTGFRMNQLLGRTYNNPITFGALPQPDVDYARKIDPEKDAQAALALEKQKLQSAETNQSQARLRYDSGLLSADGLAKIESDCQVEDTAVQTASATLFWDIESYKWIVNGLPA